MSDIIKSGSQKKRKWHYMENYSAGAVSRPTLFKEAVTLSGLLLQGLERKEIMRLSVDENLLLYNAPDRRRQIASTVLRRLDALEPEALGILDNGSLEGKRIVAMISILKTDRYFREFMLEVYLDKIHIGSFEISDADFDIFNTYRKEQSEQVANWTPVTVKKIRQVYKKMLVDLGFAKGKGAVLQLTPPLLTSEIIDIVKSEELYIKKILKGGNLNA